MTKEIESLIARFEAIGLRGVAIINELLRFRALDQMISASAEVREWGITADKLYTLAKQSTEEEFGPITYSENDFGALYGPSFAVELMDVISETGYLEGIDAGRQWTVPMKDIIEEHKHTDGIILFAYIEEYAALAEDILQELPADRLIFYTPSESCYALFKKLYPLAPITNEWPEDVIFDHIVAASTGIFQAPVKMMEEVASRVMNITEVGTAHYFIPLAAVQDQVGMNRMAIQYMLLQRRLESVREWAPLGAVEFFYTNRDIKKVALEIREIMNDSWRSTPFIALPHEVLASMDTFSVVQYGLSLCGFIPALNPQDTAMGDDGFMKNDGRLPLYMRRVFEAYKATRLEVERKKGRVDLKITQVEGLAPDTAMSEEQFATAVAAESKDDGVAYWMFTNPVAAYIWYAYFKSEEGSKILTTLSHMVLTTEALLQLMGSCRRRIIKKDALAVLEERFEKGRSAYKDALAQADVTWGAELEAMAQVILPEAPKVPAEDTDNK